MTPTTRSCRINSECTASAIATKESTPDDDSDLLEFNEDYDEDYNMTEAAELDEDASDAQQEVDTDHASVIESTASEPSPQDETSSSEDDSTMGLEFLIWNTNT
ncbi:hypothetical protein BGX27_004819 [Mortierella sp. AM989]|nr:hypothetical protein BGX27_004819 [Mortierella sp. AM989]